jgi:hypothetical protein
MRSGSCCRGKAAHVDAKLAGDRFDLVRGGGIITAQREVHQGAGAGEIGLLFEEHDPGAGLHPPLAAIRVDPFHDQPQQRRLARAIAADQRQPVARQDVQIDRRLGT